MGNVGPVPGAALTTRPLSSITRLRLLVFIPKRANRGQESPAQAPAALRAPHPASRGKSSLCTKAGPWSYAFSR